MNKKSSIDFTKFLQLKNQLYFLTNFLNAKYFSGIPSEFDVDRSCAWSSLNSLIRNEYQSKLLIVAWIHVGGTEIKSIDLHTQKIWSNEYPDILELLIQDKIRPMQKEFNFYGLTTEGERKLSQCQKPIDRVHYECQENSFRESKMKSVHFIESPLEIVYDNFDVMSEEPEENPIAKKPKLISSKYEFSKNKPISLIDFSCEHRILSTQINVKVLKKISLDSYLIGDSTETCKLKLDSNLSLLEEGKSYKIMFKDTIFEEKCIVVNDETDVSELFGRHVTVPYDVAIKIDKRVIPPPPQVNMLLNIYYSKILQFR